MELSTLVDLSQLIAAATVVAGTVFGLLQLSEIKRQRHDSTAGGLLHSFMSKDFAKAQAIVMRLPDGISAEDLRAQGPEVEQAAVLVCTTFESMAVMVYERITPLSMVLNLAGGLVTVQWRKLEVWILELRIEQNNPADSEWFQWLAEQCEHRKKIKPAAYIEHRHWQP
jgi:hypothetical protein